MKINKITINSFKSQPVKENYSTKNPPQKQDFNPASDKTSYPQGIQYWVKVHTPSLDDLNNAEFLTLKNNIVFNIDKNSPENKVAFKMSIKPQEVPNVNPAVNLLYQKILSGLGSDYQFEQDDYPGFYSQGGKYIEYTMLCNKKNCANILKNFMQEFSNLHIDEKDLSLEKELASEYIEDDENDTYSLYNLDKPSKEDINKVSSDDIIKFHNNLLSNSMILCALSCPKDTDEATIKEIKDILENQIPNQKPLDESGLSKIPLPIKENKVVQNKPFIDEKKLISKIYNFENKNTLKDEVLSELLGTSISKIVYDNYPKNTDGYVCYTSADYLNKHFDINIVADKKADISEDMLNFAIKKITDKPLDAKFFEEAKQRTLDSRSFSLKKSFQRADFLSVQYPKNPKESGDFAVVLNSITPEELQQFAKKCFSSPCITEFSK